MFFPEAVLQRVQLTVLRESFDRGDLGALGLHGEDRAGLGAAAVDEDRAGAALAGVAADVRAGQIQLLAQEVHEECARLDVRFAHLAVHVDRNLGHGVPRRPHSLHKNSVNSQLPLLDSALNRWPSSSWDWQARFCSEQDARHVVKRGASTNACDCRRV